MVPYLEAYRGWELGGWMVPAVPAPGAGSKPPSSPWLDQALPIQPARRKGELVKGELVMEVLQLPPALLLSGRTAENGRALRQRSAWYLAATVQMRKVTKSNPRPSAHCGGGSPGSL